MAVRGVVTTLNFFAADYDINSSPLYNFQNHFPGTRTISTLSYTYNSFQVSSAFAERDASIRALSIDFVATAANVDLVEAAIANNYAVHVLTWRWSAAEGIDDPVDYNPLAGTAANATGGSADLSTVTLEVAPYNDSLNVDLPWRKIPWTILGPLSFRR